MSDKKTIKDAVRLYQGNFPNGACGCYDGWVIESGRLFCNSLFICTRKEFQDYAKKMELNKLNKEAVKPVYTQEMADNEELPPVGISCMFKHQSEDNIMFDDCFIVGYSKCGKFIVFHNHQNQLMQHNIVNGPYRFKPIDTRTDEEKLIDEVAELINDHIDDDAGSRCLAKEIINKLK